MSKKKLRYSDVVGPYFYNIVLVNDDKDLVDTHFTGAAHHLKRFHEAVSSSDKYFHITHHRLHLRLMMEIIYMRGDFSQATDSSNRDLDFKETWNPIHTIMPDPGMFNKMTPDWRFVVGEAHVADYYLHQDDFIDLEKTIIN